MKRFVFGLILGVALLPLALMIWIKLGYAPVATAAPSLPLEKWITHTALKARIEREAPGSSPVSKNDAALTSGARIYKQECAMCHGLPNKGAPSAAKGMFPPPPQLYGEDDVADDSVGETYWKVAHGIRLTGMPSYTESLTESEMWQVSLLLATGKELPPEVFEELSKP